MNNGLFRRVLSAVLACVLVLSGIPAVSFAAMEGLCPHHESHDGCGYQEAVPGAPCTHECDADCFETVTACTHTHGDCGYVAAVEEIPCDHVCTDCGYLEGVEGTPCDHIHGDCGYVAAVEEIPCDHVCGECGYLEAAEEIPCDHVCGDGSCAYARNVPGSDCTHICGDGSCGYREAVPGTPCPHSCGDGTCAYREGSEAISCGHECTRESGCVTEQASCAHAHDAQCGYQEAQEAAVCGYECRVCELQALTDSLPEAVTEENREQTRQLLDQIDGLRSSMTDTELQEVDLSGYTAACEQLELLENAQTAALSERVSAEGTFGSKDAFSWSLSEEGVLTVSGSGTMPYYDQWELPPWMAYSDSIVEAVIQPGITGVGAYAFYGLENLKAVSLPEGLTEINTGAFYDCTGLETVTWREGATGEGHIWDSAFGNCSSLSKVHLPEGIVSIESNAFFGCKSLTDIILPEGLESIGPHAFYLCESLESLALPDSVVNIEESAFQSCTSLSSVTIPDGITEINNFVFNNCPGLTDVVLPSELTYIGVGAFGDCKSLTQLTFPAALNCIDRQAFRGCSALTCVTRESGTAGETAGYIEEQAFYECVSLEQIQLPENIAYIGKDAFYDCSRLQSVCIPDSVTRIDGGAFAICLGLKSLELSANLQSIGASAFVECWSLDSVVIPEGVTEIGIYAFAGCDSMTCVQLPTTLKTLGTDAFFDCAALQSVEIPAQLTYIPDRAFSGCTGLRSVSLPETLTEIGIYAFQDCESLTDIVLPERTLTIGEGAFKNCGSLKKIKLPEGLSEIGKSVFSGCGALEEVTVPDTVQSIGEKSFENCESLKTVLIPEGITVIPESAFDGCSAMESISLPESLETVGDYAFRNCGSLETIDLPANVHTIGMNAFELCSGLTDVKLPAGLQQLGPWVFRKCSGLKEITIPQDIAVIGYAAFMQCDALTKITLPENLTGIEDYAFSYCSALKEISIPDSVTDIGERAFAYCPALSGFTIPEGVSTLKPYLFSGCTGLWKLTVPQTVAAVEANAFAGSSIRQLIFEGNPPSFDARAFYNAKLNAYYPQENGNWTAGVMQDYGGDVNWIPVCTDHAVVEDPAVEPTCSKTGLTAGSHCLDCGLILECQQVIPVGTHDFVNYVCTGCGGKAVRILQQPVSKGADVGKEVAVSVNAAGNGLQYTWYYANPGSDTFYVSATSKGNSYATVMSESRDGRRVYCVITDMYGNSVQTDTVTLSVKKGLAILQQPQSVGVASGEIAQVTVEAQGEGLSYAWYFKNPGASKFSLTTSYKSSTYSVTMNASRSGRQVYCVVTDADGNSLQTDTVTLFLHTPLKITAQPVSRRVGNGANAVTTVKAQGDGLTYKWYYANRGAEKFSYTASFKGASYSVKMDSARDGRRVYCVISDKHGDSVTTDTVTLSMKPPVKIVTQPESVAAQSGEVATVTLEAQGEGLSYQWYFKNPGAKKFSLTTSYKSNSYSLTMNKARSGRQVYCVVTDEDGNSVRTDTVTLSLYTPLKITAQPVPRRVGNGVNAVTTVKAQGDGLTYRWYYANKGADAFSYTASFKGASYSVKMDPARDGRRVYCVITDAYGESVTTDTVTLSMKTPVGIVTQPKSVGVASGEIAAVSLEAQGEGLRYAWYFRNPGASKFSLTTSYKSNSYSVTMNASRSGRQVYCVVTDEDGNSVKSDTVILSLYTPLKITAQPASVKAADGANAVTTVKAQGDGLTYKWYYANKGAEAFSYTSSFKGASYSVKMSAARDGRRVYCVITDRYGDSVTTETVTLSMAQPVKITTQPESVKAENGQVATVSLEAEGDGLTYAWYFKNPGASKFTLTSSYKSNTYSVTMNESRSGRQVYCVVTDKYGNSVRSATATLALDTGTELLILSQTTNSPMAAS